MSEQVDVLAIAAHPDDIEMICGGTVAKLVDRGKRVGIVDCTRGETGTRGTPELRAEEAAAAAKVLGVSTRINLDMGDGVMQNTIENRIKVIEVIRRLKPKLVMTHYWDDLHPDHAAVGHIVKDTMYPSGFVNYPCKGEAHRPTEYLFFMAHFPIEPSFIVDVTGYHDQKVESVACYKSQLHDPNDSLKDTLIGQPDFMKRLESRARHYGSMIYKPFGEPFLSRRAIPVDDPVDLYEPFKRG